MKTTEVRKGFDVKGKLPKLAHSEQTSSRDIIIVEDCENYNVSSARALSC